MEEIKTVEGGTVIKIPIENEVKQAYIDYSMSVIVQRALPDVRDGLKPVHRRILYAMDELHLSSSGPTRKCAKIVGDVLGKYHPHGDASVYDALVRLGQDFAQRYTLITPQGNFGTIAGDPPAAYRYTEAKMAQLAEEMVLDIDKDTVNMVSNFDETAKEPTVLPAKFPFLLCNGCTGIAVGMATNMPTHNLREVAAAVGAMVDAMIAGEDIPLDTLIHYIKGPDFPTGGVIYNRHGIKQAYRTGRGKIAVRGKFTIETDKRGKESIVFTEVPYGVNTTNIIKKIKDLARDKAIDGITDANDETSDRTGMRLVIGLKRGTAVKLVLNQLFAKTELQSAFNVINLALVEGRPKVLNLKQLVECFVKHRDEVITRRTQFDLKKALSRAHILEALIIAVDAIDEVIRIIRGSRDVNEAKAGLMSRFNFDDVQSQAIVDMQLKRLTHLQIDELRREMEELKKLIAYLEDLLAHHEKILSLIKSETNELADKYGDERRTELVRDDVEAINTEDLIKEENVVILISKLGYIKRVALSQYKAQGRGGKGVMSANLIEDDFISHVFTSSTHESVLFITNAGKAYCLKAHEVPEVSKNSRGTNIKGLLQIGADEEITAIVKVKEFNNTSYIFMTTAKGVIKKCATAEFANVKTRAIIAIALDSKDTLVSAILTSGKDDVFIVSKKGKALRITEESVRSMGRASRGVKGIKLLDNDEVAQAVRSEGEKSIMLVTEKGYGKRISPSDYTSHGRGTGGQRCYGNTSSRGEVIGALCVSNDDEVLCITSQGKTLRVAAGSIHTQGAAATGNKLVNVAEKDYLVGIALAAKDTTAEKDAVENKAEKE